MKNKITIILATLTILLSLSYLGAQATVFYGVFEATHGTPTSMQRDKGTLLRDTEANKLWVKGGGNDTNDWKVLDLDVLESMTNWSATNAVKLKGVQSGSVTLSSGNATFTNAALGANSTIYLTQKGDSAGFVSYSGPTTNGIVTITSSTNSATNVVNWVSFGN